MEHAGISNATARAEMAGSRQFGQMKSPVQFLTIDEMLAAIGEPDGRRVSLLKLDVEGYEFAEGLLEQVVAQSATLFPPPREALTRLQLYLQGWMI